MLYNEGNLNQGNNAGLFQSTRVDELIKAINAGSSSGTSQMEP